MAQNSRCRVCLAVDVRMHWITNTHHKEIFEKLSSTELNAEEGRPNTICYICYSQLQRCCRFSDMCHKSNQILEEHLFHGTEVKGEEATEITHNLTVTALQSTSINSSSQGYIEVEVNEELLIKEEEIEFKEEPIDIEESATVDATVEDPIGQVDPIVEQPPVTVNADTNNGCTLPYCCDFCSRTFLMKSELLIHLRIHVSKKRYACTRCIKKFTKFNHLQSHMRIHTGEKPFACNMCNKTFIEKSSLRKHIKIHTGEKPFACNMCDKSFILNCDLQKHIRIHTGEKPYACNICDKAFNQNTNLHKHMRIHTGEKPYECKICNKTFTVMCNLKKHMRTHTGEKPFACTLCNKTFTERGSLRRHLIIHARDSP